MSENVPDPAAPKAVPPPVAAEPAASPAPADTPRRKRRLWLKVFAGFLVTVIVIVLLLPTIASSGMVRRYVVGKINERLNGTLEIADWSIGWTSGIEVRGVRLRDAQNVTVLEVARARTALTLFSAMRGSMDLGDTVIEDPNLVHFVIDAAGGNNLQALLKPTSKSGSKSGGSSSRSVPKVNLHVSRLRGAISDARLKDTVIIEPASEVVIKITGTEDPVQNAITLVFRTGSGAAGTIKLNGSVVPGGADLARAELNETLELIAVPLAGIGPLLSLSGSPIILEGTADGTLTIKSAGARQGSVEGQLKVAQLAMRGGFLAGETYRSNKLDIPIKITRSTLDGSTTQIKIETLRVDVDPSGAGQIAIEHGTIDLANARVDLTSPQPRLYLPRDHRLVNRVTINPLLGDKVGQYINPVFTHSQRQAGLLTVIVNSCDGVALSDAFKTADSGTARVTFSIEQLELVNPFGSKLLGSFAGKLPVIGKSLGSKEGSNAADLMRGSITDGVVTLDRGRTTQNFTLQLVDAGGVPAPPVNAGPGDRDPKPAPQKQMPLSFEGDVNLVDQTMKIHATLPTELAARFVETLPQAASFGNEVRRALPDGIPFTMTGTTLDPKFDWGDIATRLGANLIGGKLGKTPVGDILKAKPGGKDPLGDILGGLTGKKKKPADPAPTQPNDVVPVAPPTTRDSAVPGGAAPADPVTPRRGRRPRTTAPATTAPAATPANDPAQGPANP